jgi:hypothetical protein
MAIDKRQLAKTIHEFRMKFCYGSVTAPLARRQAWPEKLPGDFGYEPQPWVDIAWAQAGGSHTV